MNRWSRKGVLDREFVCLQEKGLVRIQLEVVMLDSPIVSPRNAQPPGP